MNFYNPYFMPGNMGMGLGSRSLFSSLFGRGITFSSILSGAQKTLNVVSQAIPVVKEVSPMIKNTKTMFKIMNEFKKVDTPTQSIKNNSTKEKTNNEGKTTENNYIYNNSPTFFN